MTRAFRLASRILGLAIAFFAMLGCGKADRLGRWMDDADLIHPNDSAAMRKWIIANGFDSGEFHVGESTHQGDRSVLISQGRVRSIRSPNVSTLEALGPLQHLTDLNFRDVRFDNLEGLPGSVRHLRLRGASLTSLSGIETAQALERLEFFWTGITDLSPLAGVRRLQRLSAKRQSWTEATLPELPALTFLDLGDNQLTSLAGLDQLPRLETLLLSGNQFAKLDGLAQLPELQTLDLSENQLQDLSQLGINHSVRKIVLKENPFEDLTPLERWESLDAIVCDQAPEILPPESMQAKIKVHLTDRDIQEQMARSLKKTFLEQTRFEAQPDFPSNGKIESTRKRLGTHFGLHTSASVTGTISIGRLQGAVRLPIASSDNLLTQGQSVQVEGSVSIASGRLEIYSPVEVDFWQQAAVLVDRPVKKGPVPDGLQLKGYMITNVDPGPAQPFSAELLSLGDSYALLLSSASDPTAQIEIVLE